MYKLPMVASSSIWSRAYFDTSHRLNNPLIMLAASSAALSEPSAVAHIISPAVFVVVASVA